MRGLLLAFCFFVALVGPATAWEARPVCTRYVQDAPGAPAEANQIARVYGNGAAMVCRNQHAWPVQTFYFALSSIQKGHFGVCSFGVQQVFEYQTPTGVKFDAPPPNDYRLRIFMALSEETCPPHDHPSYILTDSVTEGIFIEFTRVWARIQAGTISEDMFVADRNLVEPYRSIGSRKMLEETIRKYGKPNLEYFGKQQNPNTDFEIGLYFPTKGPGRLHADITREGFKLWDFGRAFGD